MKLLTFIVALLASFSALSQTVIYYEDGTTYTLLKTVDPADGLAPGGAEWCAVYEPFKDGYTFADSIWSKNCAGG